VWLCVCVDRCSMGVHVHREGCRVRL